MALPIFQRTVTNSAGDIIVGAEISVFDESTGLVASIFSNRDGTTPLTNPFFTGSDGLAQFYAQQGEYRITASSAAGSVTWRYQPLIGTLDEGAAVLQAGIYAQNAAASANVAAQSANVAQSASNFQGIWEDQTGAGVVGGTYSHKDATWRLEQALTDITTVEPVQDSEFWYLINEELFEPPCKPTFDLDFANQDFTIYDKLGGFVKRPLADLVSQGRSTAGSSVDAIGGITEFAAGENRFTFDGETGEALGYLSEELRTNFFTNSDIGAPDSTLFSTPSTVSTINPFYVTANVTQITIDVDAPPDSFHCRIGSAGLVVAGNFYTGSVYIRSDDGLNVAVDTNDGVALTYAVDSVWRRISAVSGNTTPHRFFDIRAENGNAGKTFQIACKQIEIGQFPTSYMKTLSTAVTRAADAMTRTLGQEWNPNAGTFVVHAKIGSGVEPALFTLFGDANNRIYISRSGVVSTPSTNYHFVIRVNGVTNILTQAIPSNTRVFSVSLTNNSVSISTDTGYTLTQAAVIPLNIIASMYIASYDGAGLEANGTIKRLRYYPRAFDALTLQRLSRIQ